MTQIKRIVVADVMKRDVATLAPQDTIVGALELFEEQHISGAPVVNDAGALVGVITLSDIARTGHLDGSRVTAQRGTFEMAEPAGEDQGDQFDPDEIFFLKDEYSASLRERERVRDWMTPRVISVAPDSTLEHACNVMLVHHIHRVFVAQGAKLLGVLSSFDVVRTVAGRPQAKRSPRGRQRLAPS